jgi:hypothetical protein
MLFERFVEAEHREILEVCIRAYLPLGAFTHVFDPCLCFRWGVVHHQEASQQLRLHFEMSVECEQHRSAGQQYVQILTTNNNEILHTDLCLTTSKALNSRPSLYCTHNQWSHYSARSHIFPASPHDVAINAIECMLIRIWAVCRRAIVVPDNKHHDSSTHCKREHKHCSAEKWLQVELQRWPSCITLEV